MSFLNRSRGRHRAAGKLSSSMTRSMQATAAIAAAGGIAATAGASSASASGAATFVQPAAATPAKVANPAQPATTLTTVAARPQLNVVFAKSLSARAQRPAQTETQTRSAQQPALQATSRSAERTTSRSAQRPSTTSQRSTSGFTAGSTGSTASTSTPSTTTTTPAAPSSASGIVGIAQRYLGVPYVWGGTTPGGFDCSGLTQYVYAQAGISIPRTASAQAAAMRHVSNPQPGDLVVFGSPATHIGIYVGPGQMIAAPRPGTVVRLQPIYATPTAYLRA